MPANARSRPLVGKYAFIVRDLSNNIKQAKFAKATGGGMTINIGELAEGGAQCPMKEATTASFENLTLAHGVFENMELYNWVLECINIFAHAPTGVGVASPGQLRNLCVDQLRRNRSVLKTVEYYNAQPGGKFNPGEHDNSSTEVQVEELEIAYEWFYMKPGAGTAD
jgi:phage tail-like protein